ncbi:HTH-type transcriptional repressor AseR [Fundidesulfovibrio magnetotacticus]|uniref:HTH-type transcriptional repressor AseR n=1 Tax=Fundidesulfovibrio magnetotacticus TaxID=2730080 RepID=A0A6V8LS66_9BACT|nr:metalloregulator ArsR/SmtB family transcription factor [Fundidesulfovibrio magnetotacticus]GFK95313.1 HTH-type transcriptional repressor AseR [Fundidesulfovibrio magnetotacticus]
MKAFVRVMKALSDPNRVKIVKMLHQRPLCVCELQAALGIAQPTVSNHLKTLEDAGLVQSAKAGQWVNYSLAQDAGPYAVALLGHLKDWLEDDPEVARLLEGLDGIRRESICAARPGR